MPLNQMAYSSEGLLGPLEVWLLLKRSSYKVHAN